MITLETKCWEKDWRTVLTPRWLGRLTAWNYAQGARLQVIVNNVVDRREVEVRIEDLKRGFDLEAFFASDYEDEAFKFFGVTRESLGIGYVYSLAEFVGVYVCRTPYLLHFASDCLPVEPTDWVPKTIALLQERPELMSATLTWNRQFAHSRQESFNNLPDFHVDMGFSDQCYLIPIKDYMAKIYNDEHPATAAYPHYGGELFEKRVNAWMRNHFRFRAVWKHGSTIHPVPLAQRTI